MYLACRRLKLLFNLRFSCCSESIMLFNDLIWFFRLLSSILGSGDTKSLESSLYDNFRELPMFGEGIPISSGSIHSKKIYYKGEFQDMDYIYIRILKIIPFNTSKFKTYLVIERVNQIQVRRWHLLMNDSCLKLITLSRKEELLSLPSYFISNTFYF